MTHARSFSWRRCDALFSSGFMDESSYLQELATRSVIYTLALLSEVLQRVGKWRNDMTSMVLTLTLGERGVPNLNSTVTARPRRRRISSTNCVEFPWRQVVDWPVTPLSNVCCAVAVAFYLWVASFDGPSAFLATLLILHFCCVLVQVFLLLVGQINETIFQIVIQAPNLACILLLGRFFIKER